MTGKIDIFVRDAKSFRVVDERHVSNVIVTAQKLNVLRSLCSPSSAPGLLWTGGVEKMQFGTGSVAESESDEFLSSPITPVKTIESGNISYPSSVTVLFTTFLLADEANGFPIREAGLLTRDNALAARRTFSVIDKDSDHIVEFAWTITC